MTVLEILVERGWIDCPDCGGERIITYREPVHDEKVISCQECGHTDRIGQRSIIDE